MEDWIKIYRKLIKDAVWKLTPEQKVIFWTMLIKANYVENEWIWQGQKFKCMPGQFITSLDSLASAAGPGISIQNVRTAIKNLQKLQILTNESTKGGRLITICNWDKYQGVDTEGQQSKQQSGNKEVTTNKKDKKDKNKENANNLCAREILKNTSEETTDPVMKIFNHYKKRSGSKLEKFAPGTIQNILDRLSEGVSVDDFINGMNTAFDEYEELKAMESCSFMKPGQSLIHVKVRPQHLFGSINSPVINEAKKRLGLKKQDNWIELHPAGSLN